MLAISKVVRVTVLLLLYSAVALPAIQLKQRQLWESADGRKIKASVMELDPASETVKMKRADGLVFTIGFDRFAAADAQRLRQAAQKQKKQNQPAISPQKIIPETEEPPDRFECDDVPMVRQKGNFCVPASATMIAGFHGIETDQDQIAFLSSAGSFDNQGTNPRDMFLAMQKLGFDGKALYWTKPEDFYRSVLPAIRKALVQHGPIYISFKPGVFGPSGHGCIIIGYHDRKQELTFHNPWGNVFEKEYQDVAEQARGVVLVEAPQPAPIASERFIQRIREGIPKFEHSFIELTRILDQLGQRYKLVWCSRRDARDDKRFARDTARDDGRKILDLAFHRNPAVLLPKNRNGVTQAYLFVTRPPKGGASFLVREISQEGWTEPELLPLGQLTRYWATRIDSHNGQKNIWELPMIELHPDD